MADSDGVISALQAAYHANPQDDGVACHLAKLLVEAGRCEEAMPLLQAQLGKTPSDIELLDQAIICAESLNDDTLATVYRQMRSTFATPSPATPSQGAHDTRAKLRVVGGTDSHEDDQVDEIEASSLTLASVGGMAQVKRRLELSFLGPLRNPALMKAYGKDVSGGLLLYGPPGCGKTFIARALAGELKAGFISLGLTDVLDMYVGESERRLHEVFENARRNAPAVLFVDELDALGQKRSQLRHSGMRSLVNQLLTEMDSVASDNHNVFIIGATNHLWDVDAALKRPGRFDRMVAVFPPDRDARKAIIDLQLQNKPTDGVDVAELATLTEGCSGADLKHLVDSAIEYVMEASLQDGQVRPLRHVDFQQSLNELRPSTREWFETAKNYAMFANESGSYDELLDYIRTHKL